MRSWFKGERESNPLILILVSLMGLIIFFFVSGILPVADNRLGLNQPVESKASEVIPVERYPYLPTNQVIVKYKTYTADAEKRKIRELIGAVLKGRLEKLNAEILRIQAQQLQTALGRLRSHPFVEYAEPDYLAQAAFVPNDQYYYQQWALPKIKIPEAWDVTKGTGSVVVAIVDTGVSTSHPDLSGKVIGIANFVSGEDDLDKNGHGTGVAGVVAAVTNNVIGVAGVGFDVSMLSVKVLNSSGSGYHSDIANGIIWAVDNGAKVINLSLGGPDSSLTLQNAINYAWNKGAVIVAAAGNENNSNPFYPAAYPNVIAVAATDQNDFKANFSNYGSWVDLAAPGVSIRGLYNNDGYVYWSGTSLAAPHVSGVAALIWSKNSGWSNQQVRNKMESTADKITNTGVYWGYGRVNACNALDCAGVVTPQPTPTSLPSTPSPTPTPIPTPSPTPSPSGRSIINIYAAGTQARAIYPTLGLVVNGVRVKTFRNVSGDPNRRIFQQLTYIHPTKVSKSQVRIEFLNDYTDPVTKADRNLMVDRINIDGLDYQSEDPSVYSVGSWSSENGCGGGYKRSEWLHCNGYFQF